MKYQIENTCVCYMSMMFAIQENFVVMRKKGTLA
jgi:hypothetical protein